MSRQHELSVGMRVKVVAPDPTDGEASFIGKVGEIRGRWESAHNRVGYEWSVDFHDGDGEWPFTSNELAPVETTVIEGVVEPNPLGHDYGVLYGDNDEPYDLPVSYVGKRVRVTIEVLANTDESDGDTK